MLYFGETFSRTRVAFRLDAVACERCGERYAYPLLRHGVGRGTAPYMIGGKGAANRADASATDEANRRLHAEAELVPCPCCGWVSDEQIQRYRLGRYRGVGEASTAAFFLGLALLLLTAAVVHTFGRVGSPASAILLSLLLCLTLASPLLLLRGQSWLRQRIQPNRHFPDAPELPPLTPPALVAVDDAKGSRLKPLPLDADAFADENGWAYFRLGTIDLLDRCAGCGAEATTHFEAVLVFDSTAAPLSVGLCTKCRSRYRWRWCWIALAIVVPFPVATLAALLVLHTFDDVFVSIAVTFGAMLVSLFVAAFVPNALSKPYRLRTIDGPRGVVAIRAASVDYNEDVADRSLDFEMAIAADAAANVGDELLAWLRVRGA